MRTAAAAILIACALAAPAAAGPGAPPGAWKGSWAHDEMGTAGRARLVADRALRLRLEAPALGCAEPSLLAVRYRRGVLSGHGRSVPCNDGVRRWSLRGRFAGGAFRGSIVLRLADGSRALLALELRRA